jgi:hypothetical protein
MSPAVKFIVREIEPRRWVLEYKTSIGTTSAYTTYPNSDAAVAVAKERDSTVEVDIRPLTD